MKLQDQIKAAIKRNEGGTTPTEGRAAPQDIAGTKDKPGSKTKAAGNPGGGNGQRTGNGHSVTAKTRTEVAAEAAPKPVTRQQRRRAAEVAAAASAALCATGTVPAMTRAHDTLSPIPCNRPLRARRR